MDIKKLRTEAKLTQAGFAAALDVSESLIRAVESNRMKVSRKLKKAVLGWLAGDLPDDCTPAVRPFDTKLLRKAQRMTQLEFANALGVSRSLVRAVEQGQVEMSEKYARKLAAWAVGAPEPQPAVIAAGRQIASWAADRDRLRMVLTMVQTAGDHLLHRDFKAALLCVLQTTSGVGPCESPVPLPTLAVG